MISVTRLNGTKFTLNALLIESIESTPNTIISLITGNKFIVLEPVEDVVSLVRQYLRGIGLIGTTALLHVEEEAD
ncbi:flagellar FlbD family protein [Marinicrinis lubricantis]|uniref:Flagellar FlbD family protein n=1 Tax=Marinicrinis lubricantis TaxID=2086470 RepID=A0ABW1IME6_9BACL